MGLISVCQEWFPADGPYFATSGAELWDKDAGETAQKTASALQLTHTAPGCAHNPCFRRVDDEAALGLGQAGVSRPTWTCGWVTDAGTCPAAHTCTVLCSRYRPGQVPPFMRLWAARIPRRPLPGSHLNQRQPSRPRPVPRLQRQLRCSRHKVWAVTGK